jgi:hypothetical protein
MLKPLSTAEVNFHLGDEIGTEGRNSQVFRARDVQLDAELAIMNRPGIPGGSIL